MYEVCLLSLCNDFYSKHTHPISAMANTTKPKVLKSESAQAETTADMILQ